MRRREKEKREEGKEGRREVTIVFNMVDCFCEISVKKEEEEKWRVRKGKEKEEMKKRKEKEKEKEKEREKKRKRKRKKKKKKKSQTILIVGLIELKSPHMKEQNDRFSSLLEARYPALPPL